MKRYALCLILSLGARCAYAQVFGNADERTTYAASQVVDSIDGITMYEKMNPQLGGDQSRSSKKGYAIDGWVEDYYESGKLLHKGFYEEGQLRTYKNYFENGQLERDFHVLDFKRSSMEIYYPSGQLKSSITYVSGTVQKETDYYPNGQIEYEIEYEKKLEYIVYRRVYNRSGKLTEVFECINEKKQIFYQKEYYDNGNIRTEGELKYNHYKLDYMKDGSWKLYDENGKFLKTEKYAYGERLKN